MEEQRSVAAEPLTLVIELDDEGGWVGRVEGHPDIEASGACLSEVRRRAQTLLRARFGGERMLREQIRVDTEVRNRVSEVHGARNAYEQARAGLREQMVHAADLLRHRGLSSRDVGALLGVSQQRVSQLWQIADEAQGSDGGGLD